MKYTEEMVMKDFSEIAETRLGGNISSNTCKDAYRKMESAGGCFWSREDNSLIAQGFFQDFVKRGYSPKRALRQDYLRWTAILYSPDNRYYLVFSSEPTAVSGNPKSDLYKKFREGYETKIEISIDKKDN